MAARVTVIGSSDAFCSTGRGNACLLVEDGGLPYAVDFGPTAIQGLKRLARDPVELECVLVTHLHGDHFLGLAMLLIDAVFRARRTAPLTLVGPPATEARVREAYRVAYPDASLTPPPFELRFVPLEAGAEAQVCGRRVRTVRARHQSAPHVALSYRVEAGGRALCFSGDTGWNDALAPLTQGADLLALECTTLDDPYEDHLSWRVLAPRLSELGARRTLLIHLGHDVRARAGELFREVAVPLSVADDGMVLEV